MANWATKKDHAADKKMKVKQGSRKDEMMDKKRKVMDRQRKRMMKHAPRGRK